MGINAPVGVVGLLANPSGDQANYVVSGTLGATGPGVPYVVMGPFNVSIWASDKVSITTVAGSTGATGATGATAAATAGASVNSKLVPPGTTVYSGAGLSFVLAMPTVTLSGSVVSGQYQIYGMGTLYNLNALVGSTVTGPGIPASTTVSSVDTVNGAVTLNNAATASTSTKSPQFFAFALTGNAITVSGSDTGAIFTGAGITWTGTVNIERSFDGGSTWLVANAGGAGTLAQFTSGPVSLAFGEPERGVLYRANCIAYGSGTINYRFSTTGAAAGTGGYNQLT